MGDEQLGGYPALEKWWTKADAVWSEHRKSQTLSLTQQLDYRRKLTDQFPIQPIRVVYSASGMYLAAAVVTDSALIEHALYWGTVSTLEQARYLVAVLNSDAMTQRIRPFQARGEHNPRHYDKYVWQVPIPEFDEEDPRHLRLAKLGAEAEALAAQVEISTGKRFESLRRTIREAIASSEPGKQIEAEVAALLGSP